MIAAIIQARLGSKRFPKKIFKKINNKKIIDIMIERLKLSKKIKDIIICTSTKTQDDPIVNYCKINKIKCCRGSEQNVFNRYIKAAKTFNVKTIVRLTADCPLIDPVLIDKMISLYLKKNIDYISNTNPIDKSKYPDGSDIEIFDYKTLVNLKKYKLSKIEKEHVTKCFFRIKKINKFIVSNKYNWSNYRYTLDYKEDFLIIKKIIEHFETNNKKMSTFNIVNFLKSNKRIHNLNKKYHNEV